MLAAKTLGRPVKWTSTRSETFLSDYHGRAAKLIGELAIDKEGKFLAIRINWIVNAGAYLSTPGPLINTLPPGLHAINLYRIPVMYGRHRLAVTNTTPTTAYRGAGRPNVCYLAERLVEEAARELKMDRVELRRRNLIPKDAFPYQTPHPHSIYDSGDPPGLLEEALKQGDWSSFEARRAEAKRRGKLATPFFTYSPVPRGRAMRPCIRKWRARRSAWIRKGSHCGRAIPMARSSSAKAPSARAR
jgi:carbon-monoxide dehydrogenase large subunit